MIEENITQNEDGYKNVTVESKNNNFSIVLNYHQNGQLEELWVYERDGFSTTCSAQYDGAGNLKSKHSFVYDSKGGIREYTTYDKDNRVKTRTVYEGTVDDVTFWKDFDGNGNLMHTTESLWEGNDIKSIYRDKDGNEIEEPPIEKSIAWWAEKQKNTNK